ncbi:MAG: hypothetical protein JWO79_917 [Actinomycetia bacterium]|nr:hypothetical protein [Actinomycetes bacterium]
MALKQVLADPWALVAGGLSGGMAGAIALALSAGFPVALPLGVGVAGIVYGAKVGLSALSERGGGAGAAALPDLPRPAKGSPAEVWLSRAEKAVRTLHEQTESPRDAATREQVGGIDDQAAETIADMRSLAAQVAAVEQAAARIDIARLRTDHGPLTAGVAQATDAALRAERERALRSTDEQIEVFERLRVTRDTLVAKMQSTAIGLEGLIARLAEVLALSATAGGVDLTTERIAGLSDELDGMQAGLRETEAVSRRVLAQGGH